MGRSLIIDTNVLIAFERDPAAIAPYADDDLAIPAIAIAEFRVGIVRESDPSRAARRLAQLGEIQDLMPVLGYTERTAERHAELLAWCRREGQPRGAHDLIVAAHAAETGRTILSRDVRATYGGLPGVLAIEP